MTHTNLTEVILVDEHDVATGTMEKIKAHEEALLHRAFSVFIFNSEGEMLLQKRASGKYHSPGLWTNTCCSHPKPGESTKEAAEKRLMEEMGFTTPLEKVFDFVYKAGFDNGLTEHEFDHVYTGTYEGPIQPDPEEVSEYAYRKLEDIRSSIQTEAHLYTAWFLIAFPRLLEYIAQNEQTLSLKS